VSGTKNLQLARSLGARQVIDYTAEYFTGNGRTYDLNYDDTGTPRHDRGLHAQYGYPP
jgi:hypothetical protein